MRTEGRVLLGRILAFLLAAVLSLLGHYGEAQQGKTPKDRAGIKGLRKVTVTVSATSEQANGGFGPNAYLEKSLRQSIELRLRTAGLEVLDEFDGQDTTGELSLELEEPWFKGRCGNWSALSVRLALSQAAFVARDRALVFPATWSKSLVRPVLLSEHAETATTAVDGLVDVFLKEWLKWNPKR